MWINSINSPLSIRGDFYFIYEELLKLMISKEIKFHQQNEMYLSFSR